MHPTRKRRLIAILLVLTGLGIAAGCLLYALKQNINLYLTPSEITAKDQSLRAFRVGGMVKKGSVHHDDKTLRVDFLVTDLHHDLAVSYTGVLPALFRQGQGVVIDGHLDSQNHFTATRVLAKHDEKYMPPGMGKSGVAKKKL